MGPMRTLNRCALIVQPGEAFITWAAALSGESEAAVRTELLGSEPSVYLLPESDAADLADPQVLRGSWQGIFKAELYAWCTDQSTWPKHRTEAQFRAWFQLAYASLVYELGSEPLKLDL